MKKVSLLLPLFLLTSCSGSSESNSLATETTESNKQTEQQSEENNQIQEETKENNVQVPEDNKSGTQNQNSINLNNLPDVKEFKFIEFWF